VSFNQTGQLLSVTDRAQQQVVVPVDQFAITQQDLLFVAHLKGSLALCISDEVQEAGGMLHMQAGRPGRVNDPELTDNTLSSDLLLLDRCLAELRQCEPRARHWQARFVAHADAQAGGRERLLAIQSFVEAFLDDAGIRLVSSTAHDGEPRLLQFRPALGQLSCEPLPTRAANSAR
jgi:chemotaxis receptor (MCP) glutamine deamidase CheD